MFHQDETLRYYHGCCLNTLLATYAFSVLIGWIG